MRILPLVLVAAVLAGRAWAEPALCGDLDGDGYWRGSDVARFREALARSGAPLSIDEELRCNAVIDDSLPGASSTSTAFDNDCTVLDVAILRRAIDGLWPEPGETCPAGSRGDCCTANAGPGCSSPDVAACVCQSLPECCAAQWTAACAAAVPTLDCGGSSPGFGACDLDGNTPATQTWLAGSVFRTVANDWWSTTYHRRVFVADVNADARADVVGVAANGDIWVATSNGGGFAPATVWRSATVFSVANGWWSTTARPRVWLADVTGDGAADLLGVANNGDLWVAESTGSDFNATHLVAGSVFATPGYFTNSDENRIFIADVSADGKSDVVGIDAAGNVFVARATGSGSMAGFSASTTAWLASSIFRVATEWFETSSRPRVFLADVTGDGAADLVGIAKNGDLWVSEARPATLDFRASRLVAGSRLKTTADITTDFFSLLQRERIFLGDVTGDGKVDIVGVAPPGIGDGDVWLERATGSGTSAAFSERVALRESVFRTNYGWFDLTSHGRVVLADVSGDGRADLSGIANNGDVWVALSAAESSSASAPSSSSGGRDFLQPSERSGDSLLSVANGFMSTATHPRLFVADVSGDGVSDWVGISPGSGTVPDGNILWRMAVPTRITGATTLTRAMLGAGGPATYRIDFSRGVEAASLPATALRVWQNGAAVTPIGVILGAKSATWTLPFAPPVDASAHVEIELSSQVLDRSGHRLDADGDGRIGGLFVRRRDWSPALLAGAARASLMEYPYMAGLPAPSGYGYCPNPAVDTTNPSVNPPFARALVLAGGGSCVQTADCRAGQTCVSGFCSEADGSGADRPLVLVSTDLVGFNPGRVRALVAARSGIDVERVVIAATHAHAVPRNIRLFDAPYFDDRYANSIELPYQSWIENRIADAAADALRRLQPTELDVGGALVALNINRRTFAPVDQEARYVRMRHPGGRVRALFVNYAMHPVYYDGGTGMDSDFPGYMAQALEATYCPVGGCTALFLNGGAGDVNPGTTDSGAVQGALLASGVAFSPESWIPTEGMQIALERQVVPLPEGITSCNNCPSRYGPRNDGQPITWDAETTAARIGVPHANPAFAFATLPGEPFSRLQTTLRTNSPSTMLLGYTNGYLGYLPNHEAIGDGAPGFTWYGISPCADGFGTSDMDGPSYFNNGTPTPGEKLVTRALDAINSRLGN